MAPRPPPSGFASQRRNATITVVFRHIDETLILFAPSTGISMRRLNVLLVEDDADARALYGYMLALAGYRVKAVSNVLQAFAEIQVNRPDLIVTDIAMPVISGLDLITAIRSNDELADLPVVAITAFGENLREQARAAGATDSIDKPTELERMREVIDAAMSSMR
jgi:CheY-like chemotaxis protein